MSWFKQNPNAFQLKHAQFVEHVKKGDICDLILVSDRDKGFLVAGRFSATADAACILVNSDNELRYIKSPDAAHDYIYQLGVDNFLIDTMTWEIEKVFGSNKPSKAVRTNKRNAFNNEKIILKDSGESTSESSKEQQADLAALNKISYKVRQTQFTKMYKKGDICDLTLVGNESNGFSVVGKLKRDGKGMHRCILVNRYGEIRYIKSPDNAHEFMYNLGVTKFWINTSCWDEESTFNPHKVSSESRQRKRNRDIALQSKALYVHKLRKHCGFDEIKIAKAISLIAPNDNYIETVVRNIAEGIIPEFISDNLAMKFVHYLTDNGAFPQDFTEAIVFGYYWQINDANGVDEVLTKMPGAFIEYLSSLDDIRNTIRLCIEDRLIRKGNGKENAYIQ